MSRRARVRVCALLLVLAWALEVWVFVRHANAGAKCGWFSERQFDTADGHVTRYRDTCERVVCYALLHKFDTRNTNTYTHGLENSALSCVREP